MEHMPATFLFTEKGPSAPLLIKPPCKRIGKLSSKNNWRVRLSNRAIYGVVGKDPFKMPP